MAKMSMKAYGKINLSLDVLGKRSDGYHEVRMIMQQIMLHDLVIVSSQPGEEIKVKADREDLPCDKSNLAYKAAEAMRMLYKETYGKAPEEGSISIELQKNIPVAAGLAGGSADCAAVILALDKLWGMNLSAKGLCKVARSLGQDAVFSLLCQRGDCHAAFAYGTGAELEPLNGIEVNAVLSKPDLGVYTKEVYTAMDTIKEMKHPKTEVLLKELRERQGRDLSKIFAHMVNVMEEYTLKAYPDVMKTKTIMEEAAEKAREAVQKAPENQAAGEEGRKQQGEKKTDRTNPSTKVLMTGSGPTIYLLTEDAGIAQAVYEEMKKINRETHLSKTVAV